MSKYRIKYSYQTGNSFGSHDKEEFLDLTWDNLEYAKQNLKRIEEHYSLYQAFNTVYPRLTEEESKNKLNEAKQKDWYAGKQNDYNDYDATYCIKLQADNGKFMQIYCPWCGYFETLYGAEIVEENSDMKFETGKRY